MKALLSYWQLDTSAILLIAGLILLFFYQRGNKHNITSLPFGIAILLLIGCFFSPVGVLSSHYLFSAHMVVHVLLLLIVGPLLMLGLYTQRPTGLNRFFNWGTRHPVFCWLAGVGIMWWWHVPVLFNTMMQRQHGAGYINSPFLVESLSLLMAGMLFSLPILSRHKQNRLPALSGIVYLFTACIGCSVLGLLITFAPVGLYHHYLAMHDVFQLNNLITTKWGITQHVDQQIAGLIMWVPCCLVYVSASMYLLMKWFSEKEHVAPVTLHSI